MGRRKKAAMRNHENTTATTIRIATPTHRKFRMLCMAKGITATELIEKFVEDWLRKNLNSEDAVHVDALLRQNA